MPQINVPSGTCDSNWIGQQVFALWNEIVNTGKSAVYNCKGILLTDILKLFQVQTLSTNPCCTYSLEKLKQMFLTDTAIEK